MKTVIVLMALSVGVAFGQSSLERIGFVVGGKKKEPSAEEKAKDNFQKAANAKAAEAAARAALDATMTNRSNYRVVDGQIYNTMLSEKWKELYTSRNEKKKIIVVWTVLPDVLLCNLNGGEGAIKNHPQHGEALTGGRIESVRAMDVGRYNYKGRMINLYDCGTIPTNLPSATPAPVAKTNAPAKAAKK